jgi:hypothetical protein
MPRPTRLRQTLARDLAVRWRCLTADPSPYTRRTRSLAAQTPTRRLAQTRWCPTVPGPREAGCAVVRGRHVPRCQPPSFTPRCFRPRDDPLDLAQFTAQVSGCWIGLPTRPTVPDALVPFSTEAVTREICEVGHTAVVPPTPTRLLRARGRRGFRKAGPLGRS